LERKWKWRRLHKARINITSLDAQDYTIILDNGLTCAYNIGFNRLGTPANTFRDRDPEQLPDIDMMTQLPLNPANLCITESYLRRQTSFNQTDHTTDYDLSMKILEQLRNAQHSNPDTKKIISMIPTTAIPKPKIFAPRPSLIDGADEIKTSRRPRQKKKAN
jgi:hypothetical protein